MANKQARSKENLKVSCSETIGCNRRSRRTAISIEKDQAKISDGVDSWGFEQLGLSNSALTQDQSVNTGAQTAGERRVLNDEWGFNTQESYLNRESRTSSIDYVDSDSPDWGFPQTTASIVPDLGSTSLGAAIRRYDCCEVKRLLSIGESALIWNTNGANLLHFFARTRPAVCPGKHSANWGGTLACAKEIIKLLLEAGVELERREYRSNNVPLLETLLVTRIEQFAWKLPPTVANGHIIVALLKAGANADAVSTSTGDTILHQWLSVRASDTSFPQHYSLVLDKIIAYSSDLNVTDSNGETPLFTLVASHAPTAQFRDSVKRLTNPKLRNPANINFLSRGYTPLASWLQQYERKIYTIMARARVLLEAGAYLDSASEEKPVFAAPLELVLDDVPSPERRTIRLMEYLIRHDSKQAEAHELGLCRLVDMLPIEYLLRCINRGKIRVAKYLVRRGDPRRLNSIIAFTHRIYDYSDIEQVCCEGTIVDHAFVAAEEARRKFFHRWQPSTPLGLEYKQKNRQMMKLIQMLLDRGFIRSPQPWPLRREGLDWVGKDLVPYSHYANSLFEEPTFFDHLALPAIGLDPQYARATGEWHLLYSLERLRPGWEGGVSHNLANILCDEAIFPTVEEVKRWGLKLVNRLDHAVVKEDHGDSGVICKAVVLDWSDANARRHPWERKGKTMMLLKVTEKAVEILQDLGSEVDGIISGSRLGMMTRVVNKTDF